MASSFYGSTWAQQPNASTTSNTSVAYNVYYYSCGHSFPNSYLATIGNPPTCPICHPYPAPQPNYSTGIKVSPVAQAAFDNALMQKAKEIWTNKMPPESVFDWLDSEVEAVCRLAFA